MPKLTDSQKILVAFLIVAFAAILCLYGCNTSQKAAQKARLDQRAVERVLGNDKLLAQVGKRISTGSDTSRIIETKTDSGSIAYTPPAVIAQDSSQRCEELEQVLNSMVFATQRPIDTVIGKSIRIKIDGAGIQAWSTATHSTTRIIDRRLADAWRDSADALKAQLIHQSNELAHSESARRFAETGQRYWNDKADSLQKHIDVLTAPKKKKGWPWWVYLLIVGAVVAIIVSAAAKKVWWLALLKLVPKVFGLFGKKEKRVPKYESPPPPPMKSEGYYRLYPLLGEGWQYQRVADNNRALATSQVYDDRSTALDGIQADRKLFNLPVKEAKGPLPA